MHDLGRSGMIEASRLQEIKDLVRPMHDLGRSGMIEASGLQEIKDLVRPMHDLGRSGMIEALSLPESTLFFFFKYEKKIISLHLNTLHYTGCYILPIHSWGNIHAQRRQR